MRVNQATKEATRRRLLDAGARLFISKGFDRTNTRDISTEARVAAGTLFNYFPSKEALAAAIVAEALDAGLEQFDARQADGESLEEDLFSLIMAGLRRLAPYRTIVGVVFETALSPFASPEAFPEARRLQQGQLEAMTSLLIQHGIRSAPTFVVDHLYWTLYIGVVAFWSRDDSPQQRDTLAVLDQSLRLFVQSLSGPFQESEVARDAECP